MARAASSKAGGSKEERRDNAQAAAQRGSKSDLANPVPSVTGDGGEPRPQRPRTSRSRTPIEASKDANVLASGKAASSPSSPSSPAAVSPGYGQKRGADGCLRAAPGGSGRALALCCARRPRASADDGQTDASGGDSELQMGPAQSNGRKVADLPPKAASSSGAPTRSTTQVTHGAQERSTVSHPATSACVEQVTCGDAPALNDTTARVLGDNWAAERRARAQRCVGIDLGKKAEVCEVRDGEVVWRANFKTKAELERVLGPTSQPAQVAIEACREAWFYHDLLMSWGHKVLMIDTTRARSLGIGQHKRKNDRIDAETLARAVESGRVPLAHVLSPQRRQMRAELGVRRALVQTRAEYVVTVRGLLRSWGVQAPSCDPENFASNMDKLLRERRLSKEHYAKVEPLITVLKSVEPQIKKLDAKLKAMVESVDIGKVLMSCPGVGPIVACSFISVIDEAGRFRNAHQVEAYLGLVPSESTSGKRKLGSITKAGNAYLRAMLVQAAWHVLRARTSSALKVWGMAIAAKKGKRVAVVAIARRLAGIMWAMWRDNEPYNPDRIGKASSQGLRKQAQRVENTARAIEASC